jgi:hypothetical protein
MVRDDEKNSIRSRRLAQGSWQVAARSTKEYSFHSEWHETFYILLQTASPDDSSNSNPDRLCILLDLDWSGELFADLKEGKIATKSGHRFDRKSLAKVTYIRTNDLLTTLISWPDG